MALVHAFEGDHGQFEPRPVRDPAGNWEIGWSHKLPPGFDRNMLWAKADADAQVLKDLEVAAQGICDFIGASVNDLTDNQYAALIDFTYNEGVERFEASTLGHLVKIGNLTLAPLEFAKWVYAHDPNTGKLVQLAGLVARRKAELSVWNT